VRLIVVSLLLLAADAAAAHVRSTPSLGLAEGRCRPNEAGPAVLIDAIGLKDRSGVLRAELYPANEHDFLADDNALVEQGKTFRRVELVLASPGPARLCIRAPAPGAYALALIHDRDQTRGFSLLHDGIGFPGNPKLGFSRPAAAAARIVVPTGVVETQILLNYRRGLFSFGPLPRKP
jgi:uncharacterized protein (DUF2141 family)